MKKFTVIWVNSWMRGSQRISVTKKTFIKCQDIETLMKEYGEWAVYVFEGFVLTIGEEEPTEDQIESIPVRPK